MSEPPDDLDAAEQALRSAMLAADVAALDGLIDDDLLFIGPDGGVLTKAVDLDRYRSGVQRIDTVEVQASQRHVRQEVASVTVVAVVAGTFAGQAFEGRFRYLRVWHRTAAGWRIVAGSATPLAA